MRNRASSLKSITTEIRFTRRFSVCSLDAFQVMNAGAHDKSEATPTSPPKPNLGEARRVTNAANAKKSTGRKTARGKRHSSFNSLWHFFPHRGPEK